jgi:outer membrane protein TolC
VLESALRIEREQHERTRKSLAAGKPTPVDQEVRVHRAELLTAQAQISLLETRLREQDAQLASLLALPAPAKPVDPDAEVNAAIVENSKTVVPLVDLFLVVRERDQLKVLSEGGCCEAGVVLMWGK